jgi:hypothetical protein
MMNSEHTFASRVAQRGRQAPSSPCISNARLAFSFDGDLQRFLMRVPSSGMYRMYPSPLFSSPAPTLVALIKAQRENEKEAGA